MWGKNESPASNPAHPKAAEPVQAAPAPQPVSAPLAPPAAPAAMPEPQQSWLGKSFCIKGDISGKENLFIDGQLEGSVEMPEHSVTVGQNGKLKANVVARNISVHGSLHGNLQATGKIEVGKTGSLLGDVTTAGIGIEDGAYFKGSIDILRPNRSGDARQPASPVPHVAPPAKPLTPPLQPSAVVPAPPKPAAVPKAAR